MHLIMTLLGFLLLLLLLSLAKMFLFSRPTESSTVHQQQSNTLPEVRDLDEANQPQQDWLQAHS